MVEIRIDELRAVFVAHDVPVVRIVRSLEAADVLNLLAPGLVRPN